MVIIMNTIGNYYIKNNKDTISNKDAIIKGKNYRFTILTDRLVRLEYSTTGTFEDRPTQRVIFRNFPKPNFTFTQSEMLLQIITSYFTLDYVKEKNFDSGKLTPGSNLKVTLLNSEHIWYYNHPQARNFGTINYSLDDFKGRLKLSKGLYSTDGFAVIDDSDSLVLTENGNFIPRENKEIDLYVFMYRKDLGLCLQDYYTLTGYPQMLPRYVFGNWWHKDQDYTTNDIFDIVNKFRENNIPLSVFLLGNKWHKGNDIAYFNESIINPITLKKGLNNTNVKLALTIKPNETIKEGTNTYNAILEQMNINTKELSLLPLTTNKLNIYINYIIINLLNKGIDAFNLDYNNINDKSTLALLSYYHNTIIETFLNRRGVVLSRNHNYAPHRNIIVTTGKTRVDWNTLSIIPEYYSSASNYGLSYVTTPIGGYYGGIENFELYIRYIQLGTFSTILLLASDGGKYYKREPWRWNLSQQEIIKKYLNLKNMLIPYLYTEAYIYHKKGSPIIQPLYYKYPKIYDEPTYKNQYFYGSSMLVCPITKKKNELINRTVQKIFIPEGTWYDFISGKKYLGNKYYDSFYEEEEYPVFCKAGSIIPLSLDMTTNNPTNLEIDVFPGANGAYSMYEDDGFSTSFNNGSFCITEFTYTYAQDSYTLAIKPQGSQGLIPDIRTYKIKFRNTNTANIKVSDGTNNLPCKAYLEKNDLIILIPNIPSSKTIIIECTGNNLENSTLQLINDDIRDILENLQVETTLKEKIDEVLFSDLPIKKKRIAIRKLKKYKLEPKFINMFLGLLDYIKTV